MSKMFGYTLAGFNAEKKIGWNREITQLADHLYLPAFKINKKLEKITGLQITSPDLRMRENEIPFPSEKEISLEEASADLLV